MPGALFHAGTNRTFKATFGVTVVAEDGLTVLGNAREISSEVVEDGKRRTRFADTLPMSTYIVAVVIGPFELSETRNVDGVPLRIGSVPGRGALRAVAEEAAVHALSFLSSYFSMPYPADKLDHVGIPDFAAGAMENLGLVTYRETALLVAADSLSGRTSTGGVDHRPRNGSHVVRRPRHHALVGGRSG